MCPASPPFLVLRFAFSIIHESGRVVKNRNSKRKHKKKNGGLGTRLGIPRFNCLGFAVERLNTSVKPTPNLHVCVEVPPPLLSPYVYSTTLMHLCPPISQVKRRQGALGRDLNYTVSGLLPRSARWSTHWRTRGRGAREVQAPPPPGNGAPLKCLHKRIGSKMKLAS